MMANFFSQFESPVLLGIPLSALAMIAPCLLLSPPSEQRFLTNRYETLLTWFITTFLKQMLLPISPKGHKWALMFTSLMLYLMIVNLLGLLPYTFTPTTQLSLNLALAFPLWLMTVIQGLRNSPTHALAHLLPENSPLLLAPFLVVIETVSLLIRPVALAVRLTANLTAGHLLIQLTATAAYTLLSISKLASCVVALLLLLLSVLEVAVAVIQAYVFVLLLTLYLQENL